MTAENNGVPEDDDPFAYLYRSDGDGGGAGSEAPTQQHNVPRTSYAQATQVGRTQYGQQRQQGGYGYPQQPPAAPTQQLPGQQQRYTPPPGGGRAAGRSGGSGGGRGVAIGAVAVVLAVVVGIGVAMFTSNGKDTASSGNSPTPTATQGASNDTASSSASPSATLPGPADADTMQVTGAQVMGDHTGAKSKDGKFVATMRPGAAITWTVTAPKAGQYQLWIRYANAGPKTSATVTADGGTGRSIDLPNYTNTNDWNNAWYYYWTIVKLNQGPNTIVLSSAPGQGNYNVDQLALTDNCGTSACKPSGW